MGLITNTFNAVGSFFNRGIFSSALRSTKRNLWRSYFVDKKSPILVDMNDLIDVYESCPHLNSVINTRAEMLSNGTLRMRKKSDKSVNIEKHYALDLMKNPNPLQSQKEFAYEYGIYDGIYSNNFNYRNKMLSGQSKTLWNLPSGLIKIIPTGKTYNQVLLSDIILRYELYGTYAKADSDLENTFDTDQVMHVNSGISKSLLVSESRLVPLLLPISNIIGALKTRNLFIYHGPKIIISNNGADSDGGIPLDADEQKKIESQFNKVDYGINDHQSHTVVTTASVKSEKLSYPTKDLMLFEEIIDSWKAICAAFNMDQNIFPFVDATYDNKKAGEIRTYNGPIKTLGESYCNQMDKLLLNAEEDAEFWLDFSHLYCMQEEEGAKASALKTKVDAIVAMVTGNIINPAQAQEVIQRELGIDIDESLASKNVVVDRLREFSPLVANNLLNSLTTNQVLALLDLPGIGIAGDVPRSSSVTVNHSTPS